MFNKASLCWFDNEGVKGESTFPRRLYRVAESFLGSCSMVEEICLKPVLLRKTDQNIIKGWVIR